MKKIKIKTADDFLKVKGRLILVEVYTEDISKDVFNSIVHIAGGQGNVSCYNPIIISDTEPIEVGDRRYDAERKSIGTCVNEEERVFYEEHNKNYHYDRKYFKILAMPEYISPQRIKDIQDGKLKDGDEVSIMCRYNTFEEFESNNKKSFDTHLKLCNGYVDIVSKAKKAYTVEEVDYLLNKLLNGILATKTINIAPDSNSIAKFIINYLDEEPS